MTTARAVNPGVGGLAAVARKSLKAMEDFFDGNVWNGGGEGRRRRKWRRRVRRQSGAELGMRRQR
jgi:hypothetical protein